jgi:hypothetical protein
MAQLVDPARRGLIPQLDLARDADAVAQSLHGVYLIALLLAVAISALALALPPQLRSGIAVARPSANGTSNTPGEPGARGERVGHEA